MSAADLIKLGVSALAVGLMVALAAWARIARPTPPLDAAAAKALLAQDFPDKPIDQLWIADDGRGAIARAGAEALILSQMGDGYVSRHLPWTHVAQATVRDGRLQIPLGDVAAPRARLRLASWPPREQGHEVAA